MADSLLSLIHDKLAITYPAFGPKATVADLLKQFAKDNPTYKDPVGGRTFYSATNTESLTDAAYRWWSAYVGGGSQSQAPLSGTMSYYDPNPIVFPPGTWPSVWTPTDGTSVVIKVNGTSVGRYIVDHPDGGASIGKCDLTVGAAAWHKIDADAVNHGAFLAPLDNQAVTVAWA